MFLIPVPTIVPTTQIIPVAEGAASQSPWRYDDVLAGMVAKGLGLDAISAYLGTEALAVMERVVMLGLATPHDKPLRRLKHLKAWPLCDFRLFIDCWLDNWKASSTAEVFGRSIASIYAQVRRLGLPRRSRRELRQATPEALDQVRRARGILPLPTLFPDPFNKVDHGLVKVITQASGEILRIERKQNRDEVKWTVALDLEVSDRAWSNQHYKAIASDLGISPRAVCTRLSLLGLPPRDRKELVDFYDPEIGRERLRKSGFRLRECTFRKAQGTKQVFWAAHFGQTTSKIAKRSKAYRALG